MRNIKGAIFDADGTMIDSMSIWDTVAGIYLRSQGAQPRPDLNSRLLEIGSNRFPAYFQESYGVKQTEDEIRTAINDMLVHEYGSKAPAKDGVIQTLGALREGGIKMCVVTATDRHLIEPVLKRNGLLDYFTCVFTCNEEGTNKHSPDIFIRAAAFLGTEISETVIFEDALYAIETAKTAGFSVVGVFDETSRHHQDDIKRIADYYYTTLSDFRIDHFYDLSFPNEND